ncbi:MAG TPA: glycoside hydrolase family 3 C-terminal domain-containing protein, partial [Prolixibacteraceae bacterium]|nr:glycoside hydrolase family 3 C-terminal domain-containing protein [Prolixibacteraceae bacterium]
RGYEHLGIPEIRMADGPVGVRNPGPSTAFPASIALAASFDKELAKNVGAAIASEAKAKNIHIMLGPAMNIHRAPFCGRNFEYLGEDPFLAGKMAAAYTRGMQDEGVIATAKHYAANYQDFNRHRVSSDMDERTLHEIYLPAFKTCVSEGKVATVMTSYNLINGIHASEHDYLDNQILKGKWGFDGFIMSDWVSTYDGVACARGGLDLEMPSGKYMHPDTLIPAIERGEIDEALIDEKIRRILNVYKRFGLLKNANIAEGYTPDSQWVRGVALDAARGGTVLLKNEAGFLPLKKAQIQSIAVIGPNAHPAMTGGGGSSHVDPLHPLSMYEALQKISGEETSVVFAKGVYTGERLPKDFFNTFDFYVKKDGQKEMGVEATFYKGIKPEGEVIASKTFSRLNIKKDDMMSEKVPGEDFSVRFSCYFSPEESGSYWLGLAGDDGYRLFVDGAMVLEQWQNQGETIRKYEGEFQKGKEYKIDVDYYQAGGDAVIRLAAQKRSGKNMGPEEYLAEAVEAARKADLAVVCVGFSNETESEGSDRPFEMPFMQNTLVEKVASVNPNTVVVLNAGGNVDMSPWIDKVKGLIHAWYPGQEGSLAVAEILFGITNPSGKLPVSFEEKWEDNPTFNSYFDDDQDLKVAFTEGIFVGYRHYDKSKVKPRFPFGFGLSYTTFDYAPLTLENNTYPIGKKVRFTVDVTNSGSVDGAEVVQVYVSDKEASLPRPEKELKAFEKVFLKKGERKTVELELDPSSFSFYDPEVHDWVSEPGEFEILVGSSSTDIRQRAKVVLE